MNPIVGDLRVVRCCIAVMVCLFLSSCTKHQPVQQKSDTDRHQASAHNIILDSIAQQEAMLIDIPIPFYNERILPSDYCTQSDTLVFGYKSPLVLAQAIDFFMQQMERYGWQHLVSFEAGDVILQFASPDRYCTIVIKDHEKEQHSSIFIYIKKAST